MDRFRSEWYEAQFAGVCHRLNQQASEIAAVTKRLDAAWRLLDEYGIELAGLRQHAGRTGERIDIASRLFVELRSEVEKLLGGADDSQATEGDGRNVD